MACSAVVECDSPHDLFLKASYAVTKLQMSNIYRSVLFFGCWVADKIKTVVPNCENI